MHNPDVQFYLRKRYYVCLWIAVGYVILMMFGTNITFAMVELTSNKTVITENGTIVQKPEVDWDSKMEGFILSAYYFGFVFAPIGGISAAQFGGVKIFGLGIFIGSLLTILTSFLLRSGFYFLLLARFFIGLVDSCSTSSVLNIFTQWTPPHERSRLTATNFIAIYLGVTISFTLGGFLVQNYGKAKLTKYIWKSILTSKPAWAIFCDCFCFSWLNAFIMNCLPLYIKDSFSVDVESIGFISSVPILGNMVGIIFFSFIADYCRSNGIMRIGNIHRLFAAIGQLSCAVFLLLISFWANYTQSLILFTVMRFFAGSAQVTYQVAMIDMFCAYSGIVSGIAHIFFTVTSLLSTTVMGFMVTDHSQESWNLYFAFLSVFNILGFIIFYIFGSGELQEWAAPKVIDEPKKNSALPVDNM